MLGYPDLAGVAAAGFALVLALSGWFWP